MAKIAIFTEEDGRVVLTHNMPDQLTAERLAEGVLVDESAVPEYPTTEENEAAKLYYVDGAFSYQIVTVEEPTQ